MLADTMELMSLPIPAWLQRWVSWSKLGSVERSFRTIHRSLHWLGVKSNPAHTPAESAALLTNRLPVAAIDIEALLHEYQQTLFGPHPGSPAIAREAAKSIQRISLQAAIQRQMKTMQNFGRRQVPLRGTTVQPKGKNN